jgi:hypothetical protein
VPEPEGVPAHVIFSRWLVTGSATITEVGKRAAGTIIADMRRGHVGRSDRRPPGLLGGPLPGQQHHWRQAPLRQAHQG